MRRSWPALGAAVAALAVVLPAGAMTLALRGAAVGGPVTCGGLHGVVTKAPAQPVCVAEKPCSAPAPGVLLEFVRGGLIRQATTDADGAYRIALDPGEYTVRIMEARFGFSPRVVTVPPGGAAVENFSIDTGIR